MSKLWCSRVAVGQLLALLRRAALALAEVADRGDEVLLLVGEGEVHGGSLAIGAKHGLGQRSPERDSNS